MFVTPNLIFLCDLKLITLGQPLLGEKYVAQKIKKERKKRKIIPKIVDPSFCSNAYGQRTHSAWTNYLVFLFKFTRIQSCIAEIMRFLRPGSILHVSCCDE
jgi:hypothetical protein